MDNSGSSDHLVATRLLRTHRRKRDTSPVSRDSGNTFISVRARALRLETLTNHSQATHDITASTLTPEG